jgi:TPR repeat protein
MSAANDEKISSLLSVAIECVERQDAHSLSFAILRHSAVNHCSPNLALGTALQHIDDVPDHLAANAIHLLQQSDDPMAYYALASIFSNGLFNMPKSDENTFSLLSKAAERSMPEAALYLGIYLHVGIGCTADIEKSTIYFKQASDAGFLFAKSQLIRNDSKLNFFKKWLRLTAIAKESAALTIKNPQDKRLFLLAPGAELWNDQTHGV